MPKVAVVTDSTAYLPDNLLKKYAIRVIPLTIIWENETFLDGVDIQPDDFYRRLAKSKAMPTTSQVTVSAMQSSFQNLLDEGFDVLGIFISSKFSGTIEFYRPAAAEFDRTLPLTPTKDGTQTLDVSRFAAGLWLVRVRWNAGGQDYFLEKKVAI